MSRFAFRCGLFVVLVLLLMVMSSCRSVRPVAEVRTEIRDTVITLLTDTLHVWSHHDTTFVTSSEVVTERIIQRYDPQTGRMSSKEINRIVSRRADSLAAHRIDSVFRERAALTTHSASVSQTVSAHPPARPWYCRYLSLIIATFVVFLSLLCVRVFLKSK